MCAACSGLAALSMATGTAASPPSSPPFVYILTPLLPVGSPARSVLIPPPLLGPQCQLHILYSCPSAPHLHRLHSIPTLQCDVALAVIDSLIPHPPPSSHHLSPPPPSRRTPPQDCHPLQPPCSSHQEGHHSTN